MRAARLGLGLVAAFAIAAGGARAADPAPVVLCDFEKGEVTDGWTLWAPSASATAAPNGRGLRLKIGDGGSISRSFEPRDWRTFHAMSMRLRVEGDAPIDLVVQLTRTDSTAVLMRQFEVEPGDWREVVLPLSDFRDDAYDQAGSFARVDRFALELPTLSSRSPPTSLSIDDLALLPGDRGTASWSWTPARLRTFAFGDAKARTIESRSFILVDDASELRDSDAKKLLARLEEGLKVLGERYEVAAELDDKVPFLLFATHIAYERFISKLGKHFVEKPKSAKSDCVSTYGMAVALFDAKRGWERPDFVHEALHCVIQRRLGVIANGNWVQEGLASAVETRLCPASLDRKQLSESFAKRGAGLLPWLDAIDDPIAPVATYPQLVTIMDFLAEKRRDALPKVWETVRALRDPLYKAAPYAIADTLGTSVAALEKEWYGWGAKFYAGK